MQVGRKTGATIFWPRRPEVKTGVVWQHIVPCIYMHEESWLHVQQLDEVLNEEL